MITIVFCFIALFRYVHVGRAPATTDQGASANIRLDVNDIFKSVSERDVAVLVNERRNLYREARLYTPNKVPKELAAINEQTQIPIYMDNLPRPPRKCRIISS